MEPKVRWLTLSRYRRRACLCRIVRAVSHRRRKLKIWEAVARISGREGGVVTWGGRRRHDCCRSLGKAASLVDVILDEACLTSYDGSAVVRNTSFSFFLSW
jgi:hypothetical protein